MTTIRDATPQERELILSDLPMTDIVIPDERHLTDREVAYFCGVPWARVLRQRFADSCEEAIWEEQVAESLFAGHEGNHG